MDKCDAGYIAGKLLETADDIECSSDDKTLVVSIVTDNCACMKKAWDIFRQSRPKILTFGCAAHAFHLFMKDVSAQIPSVSEAVMGATVVARVLRSSTKAMGRLRRAQHALYGKEMGLFLPGKTRWLSMCNSVGSVLRSRSDV